MDETGRPIFRVPSEHATVAAALALASEVRGTVVIGAGVFREAATLKVCAGVTVEGIGEATVLESATHTVIACADGAERVANMCIRQIDDDTTEPVFGIELRGKTVVERCQISARSRTKNSAGVLARGSSSAPTLRGCTVHDCGQSGVLLATGARSSLLQCTLRSCGGCASLVLGNCVLDLEGCVLTGCAESAVLVVGHAAATLVGCKLVGNGGGAGLATVSIKAAGGASGRLGMRDCIVAEGSGVGVQLSDGAEASIAKCSIRGCVKAGVAAKAAGKLQLLDCDISEGAAAGVLVMLPGPSAMIKGNTLRANGKAALQVSAGASPTLHSNRILDGHGPGIYIFDGAAAQLLHNHISGCAGPGITVEGSAPLLERNTVCAGADVGIVISGTVPRAGGASDECAAHAGSTEEPKKLHTSNGRNSN